MVVLGGCHQVQCLRDDLRRIEEDEELAQFAVGKIVLLRVERVEFRGELCARVGIRLAHAREAEFIGTEQRELLEVIEFCVIDLPERFEHTRLECLVADASEGDQRLDCGLRIFFLERALGPRCGGLALDRDTRGPAHKTVLVPEIRPCFRDGFGAGAFEMQRFQTASQLRLLRRRQRGHARGRLPSGVGHAVERRLPAAAADEKIHRAIRRVDEEVGERQRFSADKLLLHRLEARAVGHEVDGVHRAVGPVIREKGALIFRREFCAGAKHRASRAAGADVHGGGQGVRVIRRPAARAGAPSVVAAAHAVVDACRHVPRHAHVPFHVAVVGEQLAVRIEGDVVMIAEAGAKQLDFFSVRIGFDRVTAGRENAARVAVGVPHPGEQVILAPGVGGAHHRLAGRRFGVVASDEINAPAVRPKNHTVRPVFTAAIDLAEQFGRVELVVGRPVFQAPETLLAGALVHHDVEAVEREKQPVRAADVRMERLDGGLGLRADWRHGDAKQSASLVANDQAVFWINGHAHPRTLLGVRHGVEMLHLETWQRDDVLGLRGCSGRALPLRRSGGGPAERIAPRCIAVFRDHRRRVPIRAAGRCELPVAGGLHQQLFPVRRLDRERHEQRRDAVVVVRVQSQFVLAGVQKIFHIRARRLHPVGIVQRGLAVQKSLRAVVASHDECRRLDRALHGEGFAKLFVLTVVCLLGRPNPDGIGGGENREGEKQEGKKTGFHFERGFVAHKCIPRKKRSRKTREIPLRGRAHGRKWWCPDLPRDCRASASLAQLPDRGQAKRPPYNSFLRASMLRPDRLKRDARLTRECRPARARPQLRPLPQPRARCPRRNPRSAARNGASACFAAAARASC